MGIFSLNLLEELDVEVTGTKEDIDGFTDELFETEITIYHEL
jgi:hypothetical protein